MWLWLVVSLIILTACVIFALRIFATNYTFMTPKPDEKELPPHNTNHLFPTFRQENSVNKLKEKIETLENNYQARFNKLQQRIDILDNEKNATINKWKNEEDDGGWEELYYKTLKDKEEAEEALETINQDQAALLLQLKELEGRAMNWIELQHKLEEHQTDVEGFKNRIEVMERDIQAGLVREKILDEEVQSVKKLRREHELLQHLYAHLLTEADELKIRIHEITTRDISLTKKINRLSELESNFEISEYEKSDLRKSVEEIIVENEGLSAKLQELQDKLATEKYA